MLEAVLADLYPLIAGLALAAAIYMLRERRRKRTRIAPQRPDLTISEAWEMWRARCAGGFSDAVLEEAAAGLPEPEDLPALRQDIVRHASLALYLDAILKLGEAERQALLKGYQDGMEPLVRRAIGVCTVRRQVLREYGRLKYDDAAPEDWFHQYMEIAAPYINEKVQLGRQFLIELDQGAARLVEIYDELLRDLETHLLKSPRKKRFVPPDLARGRTAAVTERSNPCAR
ncbi:MAG: hypothetical protein LAP87_28660 [Acidobacteriia bacterium]|nr:hypothetical protein [Terriglobia bacterium]